MLRLRGIDFGNVMNASGARNFFGDGYWFHPYLRNWGLDYTGSTFVAKTTTFPPRIPPEAGNMPFNQDTLQPLELFPRCIKVDFLRGTVLNAVSLSGPGAEALFKRSVWDQWQSAFFISFAAVSATVDERLKEWQQFVRLAADYIPKFAAPVGLEVNIFCPNIKVHEKPLIDEIHSTLDIAGDLNIPLVAKINLLISYKVALQIQDHRACDAICMSNAIHWSALSQFLNRKAWLGTYTSPLKKYGGGGLSGSPLWWLVTRWIREARKSGFYKPIVGCGGILRWQDACDMMDAGASAIQIGSVSLLRPLRVKSIIQHTNAYAQTKMSR